MYGYTVPVPEKREARDDDRGISDRCSFSHNIYLYRVVSGDRELIRAHAKTLARRALRLTRPSSVGLLKLRRLRVL